MNRVFSPVVSVKLMKRVEQDMYESGETQPLQVHANRERTSQQRVIKPEPLGECLFIIIVIVIVVMYLLL